MINYFYDCYTILNKVYSEKAFVKQAISNTFIEEKNRSLVTKTVYGVLDKDIQLSYYISKLTDKAPKLAIRTILKIAMFNIKFLQKKQYAVCQNAVELTKKLGKSGASGFVNAFLRKFSNTEIDLPKNNLDNISVSCSFPKFAVEILINKYGEQRARQILSHQDTFNTIFFPNNNGEEYLSNINCRFEKTPFENVYNAYGFIRNQDYDKGEYTFQALGSTAICDLVEPCQNILDCCSAPGGKSIKLSYKCDKVLSWDIHEHRVNLINDYIKRMQRKNITASVMDSKVYDKKYDSFFDAVLCDAPCSGLGVTNENPDIKLNRDLDSIINLTKEQLAILNCVSKYVKIGGYLYYSTCSILDMENIEIIKRFLDENKNYSICEISSKLPHENIMGTNQFLPDISNGAGFYVAKLKRIK